MCVVLQASIILYIVQVLVLNTMQHLQTRCTLQQQLHLKQQQLQQQQQQTNKQKTTTTRTTTTTTTTNTTTTTKLTESQTTQTHAVIKTRKILPQL